MTAIINQVMIGLSYLKWNVSKMPSYTTCILIILLLKIK